MLVAVVVCGTLDDKGSEETKTDLYHDNHDLTF